MAIVLITGCNSGFGFHASVTFARQGHDVFATVRNLDRAEPLRRAAEAEGLELHVLRLDVRDAESVDAAVAEVVERAGRVDVCVNNAGIEVRGAIEDCSDDEMLVQFDTNVFGLVRVVRAVLPVMRAQGEGVIVNVGSLAGLVARPYGGLYSATKHAVEAISESLHFECAPFGIRIAVLEPGQFETELLNNAIIAERSDERSAYREGSDEFDLALHRLSPDGKPAPPEVVAEAIVAIAEDDEAGLRHLVGADAELVWSVRSGATFEQYEQTMRAALDWWE
ncbi:MAG TPA: SDR family oxidoreductase [Acidimicrobiales bacterium]|nr:SDR family oxidoreductase [Acidimicrobiales bacterium]